MKKNLLERQWTKFDGRNVPSLLNELTKLVIQNKRNNISQLIWIGTDSKVKKNKVTITSSIVVRQVNRGCSLCMLQEVLPNKMNTKQRMLKEVKMSLLVAKELQPFLKKHELSLEIHADINGSKLFKSNLALKIAYKRVTNAGFAFFCKPHAFASTKGADKYMRKDKAAA
ncbi:hypothetical protein KA478_01235 [Patescibacteria group bacterium]|nr:hypothetical protein [Patescibacteria group bacterium]